MLTASNLLEILLQLQNQGVDLSQLQVRCDHSVYDELGQVDNQETYPDSVEICERFNELVIT